VIVYILRSYLLVLGLQPRHVAGWLVGFLLSLYYEWKLTAIATKQLAQFVSLLMSEILFFIRYLLKLSWVWKIQLIIQIEAAKGW